MSVTELVAVAGNSFPESLQGADLLEICLDSSPNFPKPKPSPFSLLISVRDALEGGKNDIPIEERKNLFLSWLPYASFIDIEIQNLSFFSEVIEKAHNMEVQVIGSFHDFEKTPSLDMLQAKCDKAVNLGADIIKIATLLESDADLLTLEDLLLEIETPLSISPLGEKGGEKRVHFAHLGSRLNYGYLDKPSVSGQPHISSYTKLFSDIDAKTEKQLVDA